MALVLSALARGVDEEAAGLSAVAAGGWGEAAMGSVLYAVASGADEGVGLSTVAMGGWGEAATAVVFELSSRALSSLFALTLLYSSSLSEKLEMLGRWKPNLQRIHKHHCGLCVCGLGS